MGKGAVPKTGQKTPSPRRDGSGVPVGMVPVPKTGQKTSSPRDNLYPTARSLLVCTGAHASLRSSAVRGHRSS
ncbi:MAG: hypothetical protein SPF15_03045 [Candidatus Cryptobacteroides sp.]|uniref:hypothetical protein n=1 Tax=Candidatus Cryptobacteroides sp. TaxID=2952915 RepID=UPI002A80D10D|nr:hypothetical protein [Candidatus Cryptobacteroides sp.]MDY5042966.1 hypothetical protein [Candidatus Cryptobacteroides sp.]